LATEFVKSGYDLHWLHREILTSDTYQRSSEPNVTNASDKRNFSRHVPRRLPAEVIRDSVYLATANDDDASQARLTLKQLAISGDIGTYSRQNTRDFALQVFGQSTRETNCDCDRSDQSNLLQSIYLLNDTDMHRQLCQNSGWVAKTVLSSTGQSLRSIPSEKGTQADSKSVAFIQSQLGRRIDQLKALPENKKAKVKEKLEKEIDRINEKLVKLGAEVASFQGLIDSPSDSVEKTGTAKLVPASAPALEEQTLQTWISEAYLRTLCRLPDNEEQAIASTFIRDAKKPGEGLESLMWTLLNTKEFILSH